ncbi:porin [Tianweitania sediminis]|uniref:Porin n=1 Tax=Tianweitania sediminis TaxID=1502156 RepID=A0A8J7RIB5_9HYPH|nr:porin [Tianweitania sediminis]MBP0438941.1 porin [Tianweitania sediminis]
MNIKSLLLGSAAAMIAVSGARAADAIVIAEPEPVEYVRVCDVYGTGYFYIPGTETCLKIGGYFRYEVRASFDDFSNGQYGQVDEGYGKRARFAPTFTVKSETELGTLTGYARFYAQWDTWDNSSTGFPEGRSSNATTIDHMQISLATANGTFLVGKGDTPYSRFLGYAGPTIYEGRYGFNNSGEISYTYTGANGFSAIIAAVENTANSDWDTNFEGGVNFKQGWGSIGAIAGYDAVRENWGAKVGLRFTVPNTAVKLNLDGFYSSDDDGVAGVYSIISPNGAIAEYSVLAGAAFALTEKVGLAATAQWFSDNDTFVGSDDEWEFSLGMPISPVSGLSITPEVAYDTFSEDFTGILRFQRSF